MNDLLISEKIDAGMMVLSVTSSPLLGFLKNCVRSHYIPALAKKIEITVIAATGCNEIMVKIDALKLAMVFGNLLSNAVKFTPVNGKIEIIISTENSASSGDNLSIILTSGILKFLCQILFIYMDAILI